MYQTLTVDTQNQIATVTLNRPTKKNALSFQMMEELHTAGQALAAQDGLRAVVLTGSSACFCAGIDLNDLMTAVSRLDEMKDKLAKPITDSGANYFQAPVQVWRDLPVPVIAAIEGVALGGGLQLALGADFRIAAPNATLSILEAKWGIIPDMGISQSLPALMAADKAMELIMTGRKIDAKEAFELGLITQVAKVPLEAALTMAETLKSSAPEMLAAAKKLVQSTWGATPENLKLEATLQSEILGTPNQMEKAMASLQKREPKFS